jgi:phenylacetate-CoA ligase
VITSTGAAERIVVRVEAGRDLVPADIEAHLRSTFAPFAERTDFDAGLDVFGFTVETYRDGGLERDPVSGKVRPVLDQRI